MKWTWLPPRMFTPSWSRHGIAVEVGGARSNSVKSSTVIRKIEVDVDAREVAPLLLVDLIDRELREHHAAFLLLDVRKRKEARRKTPFCRMSAGLIVASVSQVTPLGSLTRTPSCTGLPRDMVTPFAGLSARS